MEDTSNTTTNLAADFRRVLHAILVHTAAKVLSMPTATNDEKEQVLDQLAIGLSSRSADTSVNRFLKYVPLDLLEKLVDAKKSNTPFHATFVLPPSL